MEFLISTSAPIGRFSIRFFIRSFESPTPISPSDSALHWSFAYYNGTVGKFHRRMAHSFNIWLLSTTFWRKLFSRLRAGRCKGVMRKTCRASDAWREKMLLVGYGTLWTHFSIYYKPISNFFLWAKYRLHDNYSKQDRFTDGKIYGWTVGAI